MALLIGTPFPSLDGATEWLNDAFDRSAYDGSCVFVQFWSLSCPACKANVPNVLQLIQDYRNIGLRLLSIHMPRGPFETDTKKVSDAIDALGIAGPCAVDNEHILGRRFEMSRSWPSYFLFDANGRLRSRAPGPLGLKVARNSLKRMAVDHSVVGNQAVV